MEFSRQEYWSGLPLPSPGDLPDPGIGAESPALKSLYHLSHQGKPSGLPEVSFKRDFSMFGCAGSLLPRVGFLLLLRLDATLWVQCLGFSMQWLFLWSTGSRVSVVVVHELSYPGCMWDLPRSGSNTGRQTLNHWTTREATTIPLPPPFFK